MCFEPGFDVVGLVAEVLADAASGRSAAAGAPLVEGADGDAEVVGDVVRAPEIMHGKTSAIFHHGAGVFAGLPSPLEATRYHSLVVERTGCPDSLAVTAEADGLIMGLEHRDLPVHGVQFHPESVTTVGGMRLLENFLTRAVPA